MCDCILDLYFCSMYYWIDNENLWTEPKECKKERKNVAEKREKEKKTERKKKWENEKMRKREGRKKERKKERKREERKKERTFLFPTWMNFVNSGDHWGG